MREIFKNKILLTSLGLFMMVSCAQHLGVKGMEVNVNDADTQKVQGIEGDGVQVVKDKTNAGNINHNEGNTISMHMIDNEMDNTDNTKSKGSIFSGLKKHLSLKRHPVIYGTVSCLVWEVIAVLCFKWASSAEFNSGACNTGTVLGIVTLIGGIVNFGTGIVYALGQSIRATKNADED